MFWREGDLFWVLGARCGEGGGSVGASGRGVMGSGREWEVQEVQEVHWIQKIQKIHPVLAALGYLGTRELPCLPACLLGLGHRACPNAASCEGRALASFLAVLGRLYLSHPRVDPLHFIRGQWVLFKNLTPLLLVPSSPLPHPTPLTIHTLSTQPFTLSLCLSRPLPALRRRLTTMTIFYKAPRCPTTHASRDLDYSNSTSPNTHSFEKTLLP